MSPYLAIMTIVHILGGTAPDVTVIQGDLMESRECREWVNRAQGREPITSDPVTGRPVISTFYKCVLIDPKQTAAQIEELRP